MTSDGTPAGRSGPRPSNARLLAAGAVAVAVVASVLFALQQSPPLRRPAGRGAAASFENLQSIPIESGPPAGSGRVARENLHAGTDKWELPFAGHGNAEGYWDSQSVAPGESIGLHVRSGSPTVSVGVFRLGWYAGAGARLVARWKDLSVASQPEPSTDPATGLIVARWSTLLRITIPADWVSGLYLAVLYPKTGGAEYTSFVVREASPVAPILWLSPVTTHEAYNNWGGKSLYRDNSTGLPTVAGDTRAVSVSFDRPFEEYRGAGRVLRWEYPFVRWMESSGYDVGYAADLDLQRDPSIVNGRKLILIVGHPEYWSAGMRQTLENAIAHGVNVAFFSSNEMYWQVRFDDAATNPGAVVGSFRTVTCYRDASIDPLAATDPAHTTVEWREPPVNDPEEAVIGEMYEHMMQTPADWIVSDPSSWIYAGTGLQAGDAIANLVGQEYDRYWPGFAPPGAQVQIVATSPVKPAYERLETGGTTTPAPGEPANPVQNATLYTAPSGAIVFAAGTMQWGWALDSWGNFAYHNVHTPVDPRAKLIAANILDRLGR